MCSYTSCGEAYHGKGWKGSLAKKCMTGSERRNSLCRLLLPEFCALYLTESTQTDLGAVQRFSWWVFSQVLFRIFSSLMLLSYFADEIAVYLKYVRVLGFEETPDYDFLRELFAKVLKKNNDIDDGVFEWSVLVGKYLFIYVLQEQQLTDSQGVPRANSSQ
jgi:hypothetical protein